MIKYKEYFSEINSDYDVNQHIIGLLNLGYTIDDLMEFLNVGEQQIVNAVDEFAREQMNKMKFNDLMERFGYEYKREETKTLFG